MKFGWNKMIDLAKILEEVFSYFYEDHLIILFIDKYQFVRSNSCRLNGTTNRDEPNFGHFWSKISIFGHKYANLATALSRLNLNQVPC